MDSKKIIDLNTWIRKDHFNFFNNFEEPFFGVTISVDCTVAYRKAKAKSVSLFQYYLYRALKAANEIENFRYRISEGHVYLYNQIDCSTTVNRDNNTFGFAYFPYEENEEVFHSAAQNAINDAKKEHGLKPSTQGENVIHFSALPWLDFTSLSHARAYSFRDSCPKISFGKISYVDGKKNMSVSIHVHHGLIDGYHVGEFLERLQSLLSEE